VRVVHGLERDAGVIAIEVAVVHKLFDCFDDLGEEWEEMLERKYCCRDTRRFHALPFSRDWLVLIVLPTLFKFQLSA
jgi:hypothetical protein